MILELSTKCAPSEAFQVAAETRAFLTQRGVDLAGEQRPRRRRRSSSSRSACRQRALDGKVVKTPPEDEHRSASAAAAAGPRVLPRTGCGAGFRDQLGAAADDVIVPEVARLIDSALASSLPEDVTRSLVGIACSRG